MFEIIPSPGTEVRDWSTIEKRIEAVKPFAKTIHVDIVDGKFADNTTFLDPQPYQKYAGQFILEVHLMVDNPITYLKPWADAGFRRFIGQIEKMPDQSEFIAEAQQLGEAGLAVDGPTSLDKITVPMIDLDVILIMMIKAGFSGQKFQEQQLEKIKSIADNSVLPIAVDGGINEQTIIQAFKAGARRFSVTSVLYNSADLKAAYENLDKTGKALLHRV